MADIHSINKKNTDKGLRVLISDTVVRLLFYALIILVPLIFFTNLTQNPFFIQYTILKVLVGIILIILIFKSNFTKDFTWPKTTLDWALVAVFLVALGSVVYSMLTHQAQRKAIFFSAQEGLIFLLLNCIFIFYITVYVLKKNSYITRTIYLLFIVAGLASLYGILQYWGIEPIWNKEVNPFGGRCISTFGNPAFLASFLVLFIPVGLTEIINAKNKKSRIFFFITTSFMITALICTSTRSAWLGFSLSLLILIIMLIKQNPAGWLKKIIISFLIIGIISAGVIFTAPGKKVVQERAGSLFNVQKIGTSGSQRLLIWRIASDIFKEQPILGTGWGTLKIFYPWYQGKYLLEKRYIGLKNYTLQAHNHILNLLAETGILGLGVWIWLITGVIIYSLKIMKNLTDGYNRLLIMSLLAGILGMLVDNLLNVTLYFPSPAMAFWISMGMIFSLGSINSSTNPEPKKQKTSFLKGLLNLIFIIFILILIRTSINQLRAADIFFTAFTYAHVDENDETMRDKAISEYERSLALDPYNDEILYELGNAYARNNRNLEKARQLYEKAIEINPGYEEVYYNLGVMNLYLGDDNQAIANFNKVLKLNPNNLDACVNLGGIYVTTRDWENAQITYEKIVAIYPDLAKAHLHLGNIYFALGLDEKALKEYDEVINLEPKNPSGYNNRGLIYLKQGKVELAKKDFQTVLRITPYNMEVKKRLESLP